MQTHTSEHRIIAQNEQDAWAMFCDKIQVWPGPHTCDRTIKRLERISAYGD